MAGPTKAFTSTPINHNLDVQIWSHLGGRQK